ncbi:MAG: hypothetical protein GX085_01840 [Firmicutes bacterium]|nr:hypothetical protein [Bacillota bacterium]
MGEKTGDPGGTAALERVFAEGKASHAYLFLGSSSAKKEETVLRLAQILLCTEKKGKPCLTCRSCRLFLRGSHPDFRRIAPEPDKIKLEQIREICRTAVYHPYLAENKVFFFTAFERMTEVAANAFLKTLEEPPPAVHFLALAENEEMVLPTVLSRMQRVYFARARRDPEMAVGDKDAQTEAPLPEEELLAAGDLYSLLRLAETKEKQERVDVDGYLLSLAAFFHRRLRENPGEYRYFRFLQAVRRARENLAANVNLRLLLEDLYLSLYETRGMERTNI